MIVLERIEFQKRLKELVKARKIFIPHLTKSINIAFEIYQELLAEQELEQFMGNMNTHVGIPLKFYQKYIVPNCPECESRLHLRAIRCKPGAANKNGWKTAWYCDHGDCIYEQYSKKTPTEWMEELKKGARKHGNRRFRGVQSGRISVHQARSGCGGC